MEPINVLSAVLRIFQHHIRIIKKYHLVLETQHNIYSNVENVVINGVTQSIITKYLEGSQCESFFNTNFSILSPRDNLVLDFVVASLYRYSLCCID